MIAKCKIKKNDSVIVISGKDKGKTGKVLKILLEDSKILVSGVNEVKKHTKPSRANQGGIVTKNLPIHVSNVAFYDEKTKKPSKLGFKLSETNGKKDKKRFMKVSGEVVG